MATVHKEFTVEAPADKVWAALEDFQAVHKRLARGFVTDSKPDGAEARVVTFANGTSAKEVLVNCDAKAKRLVYTVVGSERITHHNASAQVIAEGPNKSRLVWIADFLPNAIAPYIDQQMQKGGETMKSVLEND